MNNLKDILDYKINNLEGSKYVSLGILKRHREDLNEKVLEFNTWNLYCGEYPKRYVCNGCNKLKAIIFRKEIINYCKECLTKKIFGDFEK